MAGLIKQKQYDWKDSNLALFGSGTEREVKKESAEQEPAWKKAGESVGIQIWRIVKFKVTDWPKEDYGKFYNGDSYIILNTFKEEGGDELLYDVHFWIGKYSTQDEYGTAAYKTVELDTYLDDKSIQHREVQNFESDLFKSYFREMTYLEGGADSGFRHVEPKQYKPRLLHFHGNKDKVVVKQVPRMLKKLDTTDVFILDLGLMLYQWQGTECNKDERRYAKDYVVKLRDERGGKCKVEVLDEYCTEQEHEFYRTLDQGEEDDDTTEVTQEKGEPKLYRVSDASGKLKVTKQKEGRVQISDFDTNDVFILDTSEKVFVWIGKHSTKNERKNALIYAHMYLQSTPHPFLTVSCFGEERTDKSFQMSLAA